MLSVVGLEHKFLVKGLATTCYLINKSPKLSLVDDTHGGVHGKNPLMWYLIVFGFDKYAHALSENRYKLEWKELICIFIDYGVDVKEYNI